MKPVLRLKGSSTFTIWIERTREDKVHVNASSG